MKKSILAIALLLAVSITKAEVVETYQDTINAVRNIVYVMPDSAGSGDGSSWENASGNLQAAINMYDTAEVWVAAGTYVPNAYPADWNQNVEGIEAWFAFNLKENIAIYGGFNGTETALDERNWETNITNLSGYIIEGDDTTNVEHVINNFAEMDSTAVLHGFTIKGGLGGIKDYGGGMYNKNASPSIYNCIFIDNHAYYGGALYNVQSSSPKLINCQFIQNSSQLGGGAIFNEGNSFTILDSCTFNQNSAKQGGAIYNTDASIKISNCKFTGNSSTESGGALYFKKDGYNDAGANITHCLFTENEAANSGGAVYNEDAISSVYVHCLFVANKSANTGAAMYNKNTTEALKVVNCLFVKNVADIGCGGIYGSGDMTLSNTILWYNVDSSYVTVYPSGRYGKDIAGMNFSEDYNNISKTNDGELYAFDPQFSDSAYHLEFDSPCMNTGSTLAYNEVDGGLFDFDGRPRIADTCIDMGIHEKQLLKLSSEGIIYVKANADPLGTGESWENATNNLKIASEAFDSAEVWIAKGSYYPICENFLPKEQSEYEEDDLREAHFTMKKNIVWHGGFVGNEPSDYNLNERDLIANETILSGNINNKYHRTDNCYHVFYNYEIEQNSRTLIEGLTISDGRASATTNELHRNGGGIHSIGDSVKIINCIFRNNYAINDGAALYINGGSVMNCTFENNSSISSVGDGGVICTDGSPTLTNCMVRDNSTSGFVNRYSSSIVDNCSFISNKGHGMWNYWNRVNNTDTIIIKNCIFQKNTLSGLFNDMCHPKVTNCAFAENGDHGMYSPEGGTFPIITNCTFTANKRINDFKVGLGLYVNGRATVTNCIIWGNGELAQENMYISKAGVYEEVTYSCVEGSWDGINQTIIHYNYEGNTKQDPLFVSSDSATLDFSLQKGSPAINSGNNAAFDATHCNSIDLSGSNRKCGVIDMGAYEYFQETYTVTFEISNAGSPVSGAIITFDGTVSEKDDYIMESVAAGTYKYTINAEGYNQITGEVVVTNSDLTETVMLELVGINNLSESKINVYPNPFNSTVNLNHAENVKRIVISDHLGRIVMDIDNNYNATLNINTNHLNSGIYFIGIYENDKLSSTVKISKL